MSKNNKINRNRMAKRFADALYTSCNSFEQKVKIEYNLESFITLVEEGSSIKTFFFNKVSEIADLKQASEIIAELLALEENVKTFFFILSEKRRFNLIGDILKEFKLLLRNEANKKEVIIKSAKAISADEENQLKETVSNYLQKEVLFVKEVDESLIGGIKIQFDSFLFDASVKGKLERIKNSFNNQIIQ